MVRSSPEAREGVVDFLALVASLNVKRAGMRVRCPLQDHHSFAGRSQNGVIGRLYDESPGSAAEVVRAGLGC